MTSGRGEEKCCGRVVLLAGWIMGSTRAGAPWGVCRGTVEFLSWCRGGCAFVAGWIIVVCDAES